MLNVSCYVKLTPSIPLPLHLINFDSLDPLQLLPRPPRRAESIALPQTALQEAGHVLRVVGHASSTSASLAALQQQPERSKTDMDERDAMLIL
jgi:hypothetical protein